MQKERRVSFVMNEYMNWRTNYISSLKKKKERLVKTRAHKYRKLRSGCEFKKKQP